MKKIICLLVSLLLLCSTAFAEAVDSSTPPEEAPGFVFRDGVQWGMSVEEVQAIEGMESPPRDLREHVSTLSYENVSVSRYTGFLGYVYADNALFCSFYMIEPDDSDDDSDCISYLKGALSSLYGDSSEVAAETVNAFMCDVEGSEGHYPISDGLEWHAPDGTRIWLFNIGPSIYIMYTDPDFDLSQFESEIDAYDVMGL